MSQKKPILFNNYFYINYIEYDSQRLVNAVHLIELWNAKKILLNSIPRINNAIEE